jgi:adenylate cyclase
MFLSEGANLLKLAEAVGQTTVIATMFCDIRGSTDLSRQMSTTDFVGLLDDFFDISVNVIREGEGTVSRFIGDCVFAYWNAPFQHQLPVTTAASAAFKIVREVDRNLGLKLSIGIDFGEAFVGVVGPSGQQELTALGASVNNAAKIQGLKLCEGQHQVLLGDKAANRIDLPPGSERYPRPGNGVDGGIWRLKP